MSSRPTCTTVPIVEEPVVAVEEALSQLTQQQEWLQSEWRRVHEQAQATLAASMAVEHKKKALENLLHARKPQEEEKKPAQRWKKWEQISDAIKSIVKRKVYQKGKLMRAQAAELYEISTSSVD